MKQICLDLRGSSVLHWGVCVYARARVCVCTRACARMCVHFLLDLLEYNHLVVHTYIGGAAAPYHT